MPLQDIVEPLQHPLSVLQKVRRHVLASQSLFVSKEMPLLESANRHPAPSQKLPTSKQPTWPAAPTLATPLSSTWIAPIPLLLNLLPWKPTHSSQTGDSNLVANKTLNNSSKETVLKQQGQDIGNPMPNLVVDFEDRAIACSFTRACGFIWEYFPLLACFDYNEDNVIPCTGTLDDRPPFLLPLPIDGSGQPLLSPESTSLLTVQVPIDEDSEEVVLAGQSTGPPAVNGDGILHTPVSPRLTHSSSFSPFRCSDLPPAFTSTRFDDGILPTPHFSTRLPSPSSLRRSGSFPTRSVPPQQASSSPVSRSSPSTLGAHPLSFSPLPTFQLSPSSPHQPRVLASLPFPSPLLPSLPALLPSLELSHINVSVPCLFLADIAMCLCVGLSSLFLLLSFYFPLRLGSQPEVQEFSLFNLKNIIETKP